MIVIVDSNIIFSSLLSHDSKFVPTLLNEHIKFCAPSFLIVEIFKHKEKLLSFSRLSEKQLLEILHNFLDNIQFIPEKTISEMSLDFAFELCEGVDEKDIIFVALTIEYNGLLWTGDKKLINGLTNIGFTRFYYP